MGNNDRYVSLDPLLRVIYGGKYGICGKLKMKIPHIERVSK